MPPALDLAGHIIDPAEPTGWVEHRTSGLLVPPRRGGELYGGYLFSRPLISEEMVTRMRERFEEAAARFGSLGFIVSLGSEGQRQAGEERRRREDEERKAADERARQLLRTAGPEGTLLADGEAALIRSKHCRELTYGIVPEGHGDVYVFHTWLGRMGSICIQAREHAPDADVLLTRLRLCQSDEKQLWQVGNWTAADDQEEMDYFLPKLVRQWIEDGADQAVAAMGPLNWSGNAVS